MRCGICGTQTVRTNVKGQSFRYKQYDVILTVDLLLEKCPKCGEIGLWASECEKLDEACEASLQRALE